MGKIKELFQTKQFLKDIKRMKKRGKDLSKIKTAVEILAEGKELPAKYKDHPLKGIWLNCRDCHIEPDWVLIYSTDDTMLRLERTGSHADLFE